MEYIFSRQFVTTKKIMAFVKCIIFNLPTLLKTIILYVYIQKLYLYENIILVLFIIVKQYIHVQKLAKLRVDLTLHLERY